MDERLIKHAFRLKQVLDEHQDVLKLNQIEKELEQNSVVVSLHQEVLKILERLDEIKDITYLVGEQKAVRKALHEAKTARDSHPLVRKYFVQYKKVKALYDDINKVIFDPFCESDGLKCRVK